jgi:hypothetical protein
MDYLSEIITGGSGVIYFFIMLVIGAVIVVFWLNKN